MSTEGKVFLVRHLATGFNDAGTMMGRIFDEEVSGSELNLARFKQRIATLNEKFGIGSLKSGEVIIFSSPMKRCVQTIKMVKKELALPQPIKANQSFNETDTGAFSGKKASDLRIKYGYGDLIDQWMYSPEDFRFPDGESYVELRQRVRKGLGLILSQIESERVQAVFVCTHSDWIKMALVEVLGVSFNIRRQFVIPNGSVSVLSLVEGKATVKGINIYPE